jgi:hypothetical protein
MAKMIVAPSSEILEAALLGLESQRQKLEVQIAQVRHLLGRRARKTSSGAVSAVAAQATSRRELSPDARKRIATAQKKRWAAFRKNKK